MTHKEPKPHAITRDTLRDQFSAHAHQLDLDIDVLGDGPVNASIAIIGEGPGETEVRSGIPFSGGSGKLLWDSLRKYGLHRANCYTTNVVKRQISLSRAGNEKHIVHRDELEKWIGLAKWELEQLPNVRIILTLGNYALECLTGNSGITNWRGSVLDVVLGERTVKVVATINPAYALRDLKMEPPFLMDLHKLDMVQRGVFKRHEVEAIINPSAPQALAFIRQLKREAKPYAFDIEVINMETACFGFASSTDHGMCINLRDGVRNRFSLTEEADIMLALQDLCDSQVELIAQNGSFDAYWTRLHDRLAIRTDFDTLLAHHTLYPQLPHSLAFLTSQYTTFPYYKDEGKFWRDGGDIDVFWRYNVTDCCITLAVSEREKRELKEQGLDKFFHDHVMRAQPHLVSATVHGVAVDLPTKAKITEQVSEDVAKLRAEFSRLVIDATGDKHYNPNPNSWQQLQVLFFDRLYLKGRGRSTDSTNRVHILKNPATPPLAKELITTLDKYLKEDKFLGTYAESRPGKDGRFRCEYKQYGVQSAPGRLSSAGLLDGQGMNMQNQPPRARAMYIADPGMVFGYFDLKQAESQVVAYRANIPKWKEQYEKMRRDGSYDAHRALASEMFKVPYEKVPTKDFVDGSYTQRYVAKRCRHGLNYRMERERLAEVTGLAYHDAAKAFGLYHATTPELRQWWDEEERKFRKTRTIYNALGRRWKVIQRLDEEVMKSIIAFYPQSTIGDKVTRVWYSVEEDDEWPLDARVCIDVHDNLVCLASPKTIMTALKVLKRHAEEPIIVQDIWGHKAEPLIIPAELKMSVPDKSGVHRWSEMKEVTL